MWSTPTAATAKTSSAGESDVGLPLAFHMRVALYQVALISASTMQEVANILATSFVIVRTDWRFYIVLLQTVSTLIHFPLLRSLKVV